MQSSIIVKNDTDQFDFDPSLQRRKKSVAISDPQFMDDNVQTNLQFISQLNAFCNHKPQAYTNNFQYLLCALMLCHEGSSYYQFQTGQYNFESRSKEEEACMLFSHKCGFSYEVLPTQDEIIELCARINVRASAASPGRSPAGFCGGRPRALPLLLLL